MVSVDRYYIGYTTINPYDFFSADREERYSIVVAIRPIDEDMRSIVLGKFVSEEMAKIFLDALIENEKQLKQKEEKENDRTGRKQRNNREPSSTS